MFQYEPNIQLILFSEIVLLVFSTIFLYYEIKSMKSNITSKITLYLLGFLFSLNLTYLMRIIGIYQENIIIRTYISSIIGLIGALLFILWGSELINIASWKLSLIISSLFSGMSIFLIGRNFGSTNLENIGLIIAIIGPLYVLTMIFKYVFQTSPYLRTRHRLFTLTLSFIVYTIFEGIAVSHLGTENYEMSFIFFLLVIPARFGMTISIILPQQVTSFLMKFIN